MTTLHDAMMEAFNHSTRLTGALARAIVQKREVSAADIGKLLLAVEKQRTFLQDVQKIVTYKAGQKSRKMDDGWLWVIVALLIMGLAGQSFIEVYGVRQ